jgi:Photosynthesis affected mutant 68
MSDEPQQRDRLPFEPAKKRQKPAKKAPASVEVADKNPKKTPVSPTEMAIPAVVSQRMARRMAFFCGVPTGLGMSTFIASYFIVTQAWFKLPNIAVVLVSMGFFGLGVLGLTYGVLSASWDEDIPGSLWGGQEFATNLGRMTAAWRSARQQKNSP